MDQAQRRAQLYSLLGELPPRDPEQKVEYKLVAEEDRGAYILEKLVLQLNGEEDVPAYFVKPRKADGPTPVVLFNHSHGGFYSLGKDELIAGNVYLQKPPYAEEFARMGYSALCIDARGFGERSGRSEGEIFKEMLWKGRVMWGTMVYDNIRAVDYLSQRPDVDAERIATIGMSMGSTMSWWMAALDTRIKVCVDICCLTDYHALIEHRGLDEHGIYYYVPGLLKHFSSAEINALTAPRAHLSLAGNFDKSTPGDGLDRIDAYLKEEYLRQGAPENWKLLRYPIGHRETAAMRQEALQFLKERL